MTTDQWGIDPKYDPNGQEVDFQCPGKGGKCSPCPKLRARSKILTQISKIRCHKGCPLYKTESENVKESYYQSGTLGKKESWGTTLRQKQNTRK